MSSTDANDPPRGEPLRLVLLSTPRAGSNWLRYLLSHAFGLTSWSVHSPEEVDWHSLPSDYLLALHWHPDPPFLARLRQELAGLLD